MSGPINATHYDRIPVYPEKKNKGKHVVNGIIETPMGSGQKFALNAPYGIIAFHDVLPDGLRWPYDYGFVPQTLGDDGDPLDLLVINERGMFSGCLLQARVIGALRETKDGVENDRLIGVPLPSPGAPQPTDDYHDIADVPQAVMDRIVTFLTSYSSLQGHAIAAKRVVGADDAAKLVRAGTKLFKNQSEDE